MQIIVFILTWIGLKEKRWLFFFSNKHEQMWTAHMWYISIWTTKKQQFPGDYGIKKSYLFGLSWHMIIEERYKIAGNWGQKNRPIHQTGRRVGWIAMKGECDWKMKFRNKESNNVLRWGGWNQVIIASDCEITLEWKWLFHQACKETRGTMYSDENDDHFSSKFVKYGIQDYERNIPHREHFLSPEMDQPGQQTKVDDTFQRGA